jgi:hypothetical protein
MRSSIEVVIFSAKGKIPLRKSLRPLRFHLRWRFGGQVCGEKNELEIINKPFEPILQ